MAQYYTVVSSTARANELVKQLEAKGVKKNDINICIAAGENERLEDHSLKALLDRDIPIQDAPEGSVSSAGAVTLGATAAATGAMFLIGGPVAAIVGGTLVAGGTAAAFLSGIGIPKHLHDEIHEELKDGSVLIEVNLDQDNEQVKSVMNHA